jgi:putative membrane protein
MRPRGSAAHRHSPAPLKRPDKVTYVSDLVRNVRLWFVPEEVRGEGSTPDYRFSLANERTFLAWLRTALALIGGGFAVDQFLPDLGRAWRIGLALALLAAGVLCALRAVNHWVRCERAMRRGEDLPVSRFPVLLGIAIGVVAVAMVVVVLLGWEG